MPRGIPAGGRVCYPRAKSEYVPPPEVIYDIEIPEISELEADKYVVKSERIILKNKIDF